METQYVAMDTMSPFMKRVLVPFWVVRILIMTIDIVLYGLLIGVVASESDDADDHRVITSLAVSAVIMVLIIICLALDIVCIVKRARRTLSPRLFLIVNVIQTTFWLVMFILTLVGGGSAATIAVAIFIFLSFLGLLIYASVVYHRSKKGTLQVRYKPTAPAHQYQGFTPQTPYNHSYTAELQTNHAHPGAAYDIPTTPKEMPPNQSVYELESRAGRFA